MMNKEFGLEAPYGAFLYCSKDRETKVFLALQPFRSAHQQHEDEDKAEAKNMFEPSEEQRECARGSRPNHAAVESVLTSVRIPSTAGSGARSSRQG